MLNFPLFPPCSIHPASALALAFVLTPTFMQPPPELAQGTALAENKLLFCQASLKPIQFPSLAHHVALTLLPAQQWRAEAANIPFSASTHLSQIKGTAGAILSVCVYHVVSNISTDT